MDFGVYWQAGHMILSGQNVYDSTQWEAVRQVEGIVDYPAHLFPYPLPLAMLFSLPALLPVQNAYALWMFLAQVAVLLSIIILLSFYPARSGYLELLAIAGIFFFRPMFSIVNSGQILGFLLLPLALSIRLFQEDKWFAGGLILSILCLKPSIGFPLLILTSIWLIFSKQWKGIWGMICGGLILVLVGALVNPQWVVDYISVSDNSFHRFLGLQPTLWGVVAKIVKIDNLTLTVGFICMVLIAVIEAYLFWRNRSKPEPFEAFTTIVPAALLIAPYSWNYDQVLLAVPILFLLISISIRYGTAWAAVFMFGIVALAFFLVVIAYGVGHDVWSYLNAFVIWVVSFYFMSKRDLLQVLETRNLEHGISVTTAKESRVVK